MLFKHIPRKHLESFIADTYFKNIAIASKTNDTSNHYIDNTMNDVVNRLAEIGKHSDMSINIRARTVLLSENVTGYHIDIDHLDYLQVYAAAYYTVFNEMAPIKYMNQFKSYIESEIKRHTDKDGNFIYNR